MNELEKAKEKAMKERKLLLYAKISEIIENGKRRYKLTIDAEAFDGLPSEIFEIHFQEEEEYCYPRDSVRVCHNYVYSEKHRFVDHITVSSRYERVFDSVIEAEEKLKEIIKVVKATRKEVRRNFQPIEQVFVV